ncbi:uncharacterized protein Dvir_GJ13988 [Drosophila virilis]|uniref:Uncharacterized protein n=1 Tax=Drosophila virilis TaxID=7244 RepID=B4LBK4_DROVI|nr:uncharacterized protein Dvir_GJ13988 [Drosophila virilis]
MFCTESCEHCIHATSSGRVLSPRKSQAVQHKLSQIRQQQPSQMRQQPQQLQPQQQQQQQEQQQQHFPQQINYNLRYAPMPTTEFDNGCEADSQQLGVCIVTEGPEGFSFDCSVPIPNSFNYNAYRNMVQFFTSPDNNNNIHMSQPQQYSVARPAPRQNCQSEFMPQQHPALRSTLKTAPKQNYTCSDAAYNSAPPTASKPAKCPKVDRGQKRASQQQYAVLPPHNYPTTAASGTAKAPQVNAGYGSVTPMAPPYQNQQQCEPYCPFQSMQWQQQQPHVCTTTPDMQVQPLMRFDLPCRLVELQPDNACPDPTQPTFVLQLLAPIQASGYAEGLPMGAMPTSMPDTPKQNSITPPAPRNSLNSSEFSSPRASQSPPYPPYPPYPMTAALPKYQPCRKGPPKSNDAGQAEISYSHRLSDYENGFGNVNGNRTRNGSANRTGNGSANGSGNGGGNGNGIGNNGNGNGNGIGNGIGNGNDNGNSKPGYSNRLCPRCSHWCCHSHPGARQGGGNSQRF